MVSNDQIFSQDGRFVGCWSHCYIYFKRLQLWLDKISKYLQKPYWFVSMTRSFLFGQASTHSAIDQRKMGLFSEIFDVSPKQLLELVSSF